MGVDLYIVVFPNRGHIISGEIINGVGVFLDQEDGGYRHIIVAFPKRRHIVSGKIINGVGVFLDQEDGGYRLIIVTFSNWCD